MNPYNNTHIFHPLSKDEIYQIDNVWKFIDNFKCDTLTKNTYILKTIKKIKNIYSLPDFFMYETLTEKIYWNLFDFIVDKIYIYDVIKEKENKTESEILYKILKNSLIGKSSIRKSFIYNKKHKSYMYKYNYPNDLDILLFKIMLNRSTYETILSNINITLDDINELTKNTNLSLIEFDYPFPNLNTIKPFVYTAKERLNNIKKMYYSVNSMENWFIEY